jgi:hypothetical protein
MSEICSRFLFKKVAIGKADVGAEFGVILQKKNFFPYYLLMTDQSRSVSHRPLKRSILNSIHWSRNENFYFYMLLFILLVKSSQNS